MPALLPPVVAALPRDQPVLSAGGLTLRPWLDVDAPALLAVYADPEVQRWHGETLDAAEAQAYAVTWAGAWRARRAGERPPWRAGELGERASGRAGPSSVPTCWSGASR